MVDRFRLIAHVFSQALARSQSHEALRAALQELQTALAEMSRLRDLLSRFERPPSRRYRALRDSMRARLLARAA